MKVLNNNDKIKKNIIENVLVILLVALYIVYGRYYVPILMMFIALPYVVLGIRNGIKNNIMSMIITSITIGVVLGSPGDVIILLVFAPLSIGLNYFVKKRKKTSEILLFSTIIFFISLLIAISLGKQATGIGIIEEFEKFYTQLIGMQTDIFEEMEMTNYQILENINLLEASYEYMLITIPSILAIVSLFISYFNYLLTSIILRKMSYEVVSPTRFSKFKLPDNILLGTGFMFLSTIIMGKFEVPYHNALLANISLLIGFVFLLQGLSVIDFLLIKMKMKKLFRIISLIITIIILPLGSMVVILGMIDSIFDIRKIGRRKSL